MDSQDFSNQPFDPQQNNQQSQQPYWQQPYNPYGSPIQPATPVTPGTSIASFVLGIFAILTGCCYGLGFIIGIIGLVLGIVGNKSQRSSLGTAGVVLNIIGIVLSAILWVLVIIGVLASDGYI